MAQLAVSVLFFSSGNSTAAGDGRALLSHHAMTKLGARLGDPITVDVYFAGAEVSADSTTQSRWTFLATVAPHSEQQKGGVEHSRSFSEDACIIDPTVQLNFSQLAPTLPLDTADHGRALVGCVRLLSVPRPLLGWTSLSFFVQDHDQNLSVLKNISHMMQGRVLTPDAVFHFARQAKKLEVSVVTAQMSQDKHVESGCGRVTADTRITFVTAFSQDEHQFSARNTSQLSRAQNQNTMIGANDVHSQVREAIIWPVVHTEDAQALGAKFPRGLLVHGPPGVGKTSLSLMVAAQAGASVHALNAGDIFGPYVGDTEARMRAAFRSAQRDGKYGKPSFLMLDEIDTMCPARVISSESTSHGSRLVAQLLTLMDCGLSSESRNNQTNSFPLVLATTNRPDVLDTALRRPGRFDIEIEIKLPCVVQREHILNQYSQKLLMGCDVRLKTIAERTQGYSGADLSALCREAAMLAMRRNKDNIFDSIKSSDSAVTFTDFLEACRRIRASLVRGIDVDINPVKWEDIGGLDDVKRQLQKTVEWPLKHADAFFRLGISPPHGILLYGPPGSAKTTLARAAATASGAAIITLSAADVFSKYAGEGELLLRDAFSRARRTAPAIILLDEIDGMVGSRGSDHVSDESENGARILSVLLTEMDGLDQSNAGIVLATTNRVKSVDRALMRPGRLDIKISIPNPSENARVAALRVCSRDVPMDDDVNLLAIASRANLLTGAELANVVREAALIALRENICAKSVAQRHMEAALVAMTP